MPTVELRFTPEAFKKVKRYMNLLELSSTTLRSMAATYLSNAQKHFTPEDIEVLVFVAVYTQNADELGIRILFSTNAGYDPSEMQLKNMAIEMSNYMKAVCSSWKIGTVGVWPQPQYGALYV